MGFTMQEYFKEHASRAQNNSGCLDKAAEPKLNWLSYPADGLNGLQCEGFIESTITQCPEINVNKISNTIHKNYIGKYA